MALGRLDINKNDRGLEKKNGEEIERKIYAKNARTHKLTQPPVSGSYSDNTLPPTQ